VLVTRYTGLLHSRHSYGWHHPELSSARLDWRLVTGSFGRGDEIKKILVRGLTPGVVLESQSLWHVLSEVFMVCLWFSLLKKGLNAATLRYSSSKDAFLSSGSFPVTAVLFSLANVSSL
jgi:hypothetical protein